MKILYITYIDFDGSGKSGSSVRPQKMYEAFLNLGLDVKLLECQQNKFKERRKKVREILEWLDNNTPDICYIESPSGPIFNQIDLKLIKKVHNMGVPIGYFYRDAFWLFPEMQKKIKLIKRHLINFMNLRDLHVLENNCDIVYFPTNSAISLFDFSNIISKSPFLYISIVVSYPAFKQLNKSFSFPIKSVSLQSTFIHIVDAFF